MKKATLIPKKKESRSEIRKKANRFEESRDNLKKKNKEKTHTIKELRDRLSEIADSRDHWHKKSKEVMRTHREFSEQKQEELKQAEREIEVLKEERCQLQEAVESFKKKGKKSLLSW